MTYFVFFWFKYGFGIVFFCCSLFGLAALSWRARFSFSMALNSRCARDGRVRHSSRAQTTCIVQFLLDDVFLLGILCFFVLFTAVCVRARPRLNLRTLCSSCACDKLLIFVRLRSDVASLCQRNIILHVNLHARDQ